MPVDRSGGRGQRGRARHRRCGSCGEGDLLGIYPEGTRSPDGRLYRGKTGAARMALEARVPVIPVAMIGTDKIQPHRPEDPRTCTASASASARPLDFSRYEGMEDDRFVLRSMTDEIMYELMELSGQEYVDIYATKAKELIAQGPPADVHRPMAAGGEARARPVMDAGRARRPPEGDRPRPAAGPSPFERSTAIRHRSVAPSWSLGPRARTGASPAR